MDRWISAEDHRKASHPERAPSRGAFGVNSNMRPASTGRASPTDAARGIEHVDLRRAQRPWRWKPQRTRHAITPCMPRLSHAPVQPQDLELMRRLHDMPEASGLILQFGPHKGNTLVQVAMHDPDYVRQLVVRAQRPDVRAAAGRLVEAIEAAAEQKRRTTRPSSRRPRTST